MDCPRLHDRRNQLAPISPQSATSTTIKPIGLGVTVAFASVAQPTRTAVTSVAAPASIQTAAFVTRVGQIRWHRQPCACRPPVGVESKLVVETEVVNVGFPVRHEIAIG